MLQVAKHLSQLSFEKLMEVYQESNQANGARLAPGETKPRQLQMAEQDFYTYLHDVFFRQPGARYCVWTENGSYVSALRLEPYRDGLLLEALETAPSQRGKGYAVRLIQAVQQMLAQQGHVRLYSHVGKRSGASLNTHRACGFQVILDYAAYLDGSVSDRAFTLKYEKEIADSHADS